MVKSNFDRPEKGSPPPEPMYRRLRRALQARGSTGSLLVAGALMFAVVFALTLWWRAGQPQSPLEADMIHQEAQVATEDALDQAPDLAETTEPVPETFQEPAAADPAAPPPEELVWPVSGAEVQEFGWQYSDTMAEWRHHGGLDIAAAPGDPVRAVYGGTVTAVRLDPVWGWTVEVEHSPGYTSRYAGCERVLVEAGAMVEQGQLIAYAGGPAGLEAGGDAHLHFELVWDGEKADPAALLPRQTP